MKRQLAILRVFPYNFFRLWQRGALAQLGERLNGIQEVSGSIPLSSIKTNRPLHSFEAGGFCLFGSV